MIRKTYYFMLSYFILNDVVIYQYCLHVVWGATAVADNPKIWVTDGTAVTKRVVTAENTWDALMAWRVQRVKWSIHSNVYYSIPDFQFLICRGRTQKLNKRRSRSSSDQVSNRLSVDLPDNLLTDL